MKQNMSMNYVKTTMLDGMMTFGQLENGLRMMDFMSFEAVEMEAFVANCKVQGMRDGNVYITEQKRRVRNTPIFREDNATLSLGQNGRYYFVFSLPVERASQLPQELKRQAWAIAKKAKGLGEK